MSFEIAFFIFQLAIAIATVLAVTFLFGSIRELRARGETLLLLGAAMVVLLLLSARGLYVASAVLQSGGGAKITSGDWLLTATGLVTLVMFAAHGRLLEHRAEMEGAIRDLSATCSLSGAYKKPAFMNMAGPLVLAARRFRHPLSAIVIDLDHLERVNDEHGRAAGDKTLREFGAKVGTCLRQIDIFGRLATEKFAIVLPHTDLQGAALVAERICAAVSHGADPRIPLEVSVGVATLHDANLENLLNVADGVMYSAKQSGGGNRLAVEAA